mgnify:CR=1 FL=1
MLTLHRDAGAGGVTFCRLLHTILRAHRGFTRHSIMGFGSLRFATVRNEEAGWGPISHHSAE